jgi:hypothetical protein
VNQLAPNKYLAVYGANYSATCVAITKLGYGALWCLYLTSDEHPLAPSTKR